MPLLPPWESSGDELTVHIHAKRVSAGSSLSAIKHVDRCLIGDSLVISAPGSGGLQGLTGFALEPCEVFVLSAPLPGLTPAS